MIKDYEQAIGTDGSRRARQTGEDYLWEVTYTAPRIEGEFWFDLKTKIGGVYMNDGSPAIRAALQSALRE